jgi:hypothetical protein
MISALLRSLGLTLALCTQALAQSAPPAEMISSYRLKNGEGRVTLDSTLTSIAQKQANAMASHDKLDHDVLGPFNSRVASSGSGRAAENIAYGYESFAKTLGQWIDSSGHRKNLLLHDAERVGVANAKSSTGRTYWAMVIAGGYKPPPSAAPVIAKGTAVKRQTVRQTSRTTCRLSILGLCL